MKKRFLAVMLAGVVATSVFSTCTVAQAAETPANSDGTVYLLHKGLDYYAWIAMQYACELYAEDNDIDMQVLNGENDVATQVEQFQNVLTQDPKAIIVTAVDSESLSDCVAEANEKGIPVAVYDTPITGDVDIDITVDCDNYMAGQQAAEIIVEKLEEKFGEVKGTVLNVYGDQASQVMRERKGGFDDVFAQYPDVKIVEVCGNGDRLQSQEAASNALAANEIDAVHAPCDNAFHGVYEAVESADKLVKVGEDGHIIMVSIDGEPLTLDRITEGTVDGTVNLDWHAVAAICLELLEKCTFNGEEYPTVYKAEDSYFDFYWDSTEVVDATDWSGKYISLPTTKIGVDDAQNAWNSGRYSADVLKIEY